MTQLGPIPAEPMLPVVAGRHAVSVPEFSVTGPSGNHVRIGHDL